MDSTRKTGKPGKAAHINLEDMEDGTIAFQVQYPGGFDPECNAHQGALLLTKHMDEVLAQQASEPSITTTFNDQSTHQPHNPSTN